MKKSEFLRILKDSLMGMSQNDKREIMLDYEEHFIDGLSQGRTEEEICESLGDPRQIALNLKRNMEYNNPTPNNDGVNTAAYIIGIIALTVGCLWLISVLIGLVLGGIGTIYATIAFGTVFSSPSLLMVVIAAAVFVICLFALITLGIIKLIPHIMRWYKTMLNGLTPDENKHIKKEYKSIKISPVIWVLLSVLLFASLGVAVVGGVITAKDVAMNTDFDEFAENADEFAEKMAGIGFYHRWLYYDHHYDFDEWEEFHEDWADEFEENMEDFADDMEEFADDMEDTFGD